MEVKEAILREYETLKKGKYSFMAGFVPIPDLIRTLMNKGYDKEELKKTIINMFYMNEISLEYGDKKDELDIITPEGKRFYYIYKSRRNK